LKGKTVIVRGKEFICESGFGCDPDLSGTKIFGHFKFYGTKAQMHSFIRRGDIESIAGKR
jgi:hypothetical protein